MESDHTEVVGRNKGGERMLADIVRTDLSRSSPQSQSVMSVRDRMNPLEGSSSS